MTDPRAWVSRWESGKRSQPVSRVLSWAIIPLECTSPCTSSDLPESQCEPHLEPLRARTLLFGLAPGGVCRAAACCHRRGALLPHPFTLAVARFKSAWAVCFLLHFPWARAPQALPGTLARGARTFLCIPHRNAAIAWLTPGRTLAEGVRFAYLHFGREPGDGLALSGARPELQICKPDSYHR
jgi:hypothetical protein